MPPVLNPWRVGGTPGIHRPNAREIFRPPELGHHPVPKPGWCYAATTAECSRKNCSRDIQKQPETSSNPMDSPWNDAESMVKSDEKNPGPCLAMSAVSTCLPDAAWQQFTTLRLHGYVPKLRTWGTTDWSLFLDLFSINMYEPSNHWVYWVNG